MTLWAPSPSPSSGPVAEVVGQLNATSLSALLGIAIMALMVVFYSVVRGKLRPESAIKDAREDRDARVLEARADRDMRVLEANKQAEMWKQAFDTAEEARRSQEALLRETTMEIGKTVQHVIGALQEARQQQMFPGSDPYLRDSMRE